MNRSLIAVAGLSVMALAACDSDVNLLSEDGNRLLVIHGYVDSEADTQFVRIDALRPLVGSGHPDLAGVTVRSTDLATGESRTWSETTRVSTGGAPAHLYWSLFRAEAGKTYRIEADRDGTIGASAMAQVPPIPSIHAEEAVLGDGSFVSQQVSLSNVVGSPLGVRIVYYLKPPGTDQVVRIGIEYGDSPVSQGGRFFVTAFLNRDRGELMHRLGLEFGAQGVAIAGIAVEYELLSPEWTSGEPDPGLSIGHGFFAARGVYESSWRLTPETVLFAGFDDGQPAQ